MRRYMCDIYKRSLAAEARRRTVAHSELSAGFSPLGQTRALSSFKEIF